MISDQNFSPLIAEALEELQFNDMEGLCPTLQKLLNELMLIQREQAIKAAPYERSEQRQGYANGFLVACGLGFECSHLFLLSSLLFCIDGDALASER